jgi:pyruvate formate lyase activating enzyme
MKEALFYKKLDDKKVECRLCHHNCIIKPDNYGLCLARNNIKGVLYSDVYGRIAAVNVDPVEKKPLYHFLPGTKSFSIGTCGCNFKCGFCQNCDISQVKTSEYARIFKMTPEEAVSKALEYDCKSISYTYNEPTINYEFAVEASRKAVKKGLKNVFVTNGYIQEKPLKKLSPYLHAANIDLKSFSKEFYKKVCKADLSKVLETIKLYHKLKVHIELTTMIVPGLNDSKEEIKKLCKWVVDNLSSEVPLHFSRFYPQYLMTDTPMTELKVIRMAVKTARKSGIKYVYGGNVLEKSLNNTFCPKCKTEIIDRTGYKVFVKNVKKGICEKCGEKLLLHY